MVLSPILFLVLCALATLTVDIGRMMEDKAVLQNACDAGALAGAKALLNSRRAGASWSVARSSANQEASKFFQANAATGAPTIEFGNCSGASNTFVAVTDAGHAVSAVRVSGGQNAPLFFAGLLGMRQAEVRAGATAQLATSISAVYAGLAPFAVPKSVVDQVTAGWDPSTPGPTMTFYPGDATSYSGGNGSDAVVPGNWGLLNLDGGSLSTQELIDEILNPTWTLVIPSDAGYIVIAGCSGFRAGLQKTIQSVIGQQLTVAVYSNVAGNGSNGQFSIVGFLSMTVLDCKLNGNSPYASCRINGILDLHHIRTGGGYDSPNVRKVQLVG
jgi:Flp pilus assembly protein TadG